MSKVRNCVCCGRSYEYCPTCSKDPVWKLLYDTEVCRDISNVVSAYNMKVISKDKAIEKIKAINVGDVAIYKDEIKKTLTELTEFPIEKPKRRRKKK